MATRSLIGFYDPETETLQYIYCHYDGYPSNMLPKLEEDYADIDAVKKLVSGKDIRFLAKPEDLEYLDGPKANVAQVYSDPVILFKRLGRENHAEYVYLFLEESICGYTNKDWNSWRV